MSRSTCWLRATLGVGILAIPVVVALRSDLDADDQQPNALDTVPGLHFGLTGAPEYHDALRVTDEAGALPLHGDTGRWVDPRYPWSS